MNDFRTRRRCFETRSIASLGDARSASVLPPLRQLPFSVRAMPVNFSCTGITRYFFSFFFFFPIVIILLANFYQNSIIGFCFSKRVSFFRFETTVSLKGSYYSNFYWNRIDIASPNISSKIEIQLCEFPWSKSWYRRNHDFNLNFGTVLFQLRKERKGNYL